MTNWWPEGSWADQVGDAVVDAGEQVASNEQVQESLTALERAAANPNATPAELEAMGYDEAAAYRRQQQIDDATNDFSDEFLAGDFEQFVGDGVNGVAGATGDAAETAADTAADAAGGAANSFLSNLFAGNRTLQIIALLAGLYAAGQLFDVDLGGAST